MDRQTDEDDDTAFEAEHVHVVYDHIAQDFSRTRHTRWPFVERFIHGLQPGSIVLDAGCGNGKYLGCRSVVPFAEPKQTKRSTKGKQTDQIDARDVLVIGFDMSAGLLRIAADRGHETARGDCFDMSCWRQGSFDHAISIATIHHFATHDRRVEAIVQMIKAVTPRRPTNAVNSNLARPISQIMIVVWALEQDDTLAGAGSARKAGKKGAAPVNVVSGDHRRDGSLLMSDEQDVFVSWERQPREYYSPKDNDDVTVALSDAVDKQLTVADGVETRTFQRYYHLFKRFELAGLVAQAAARIGATFKQPQGYPAVDTNAACGGERELLVELKEERWERENWVAVIHVGWRITWGCLHATRVSSRTAYTRRRVKMSQLSSHEPNVAVLYDVAALSALKRPQLVALCRVHAIKATGKNIELVHKLAEHGKQLVVQDCSLNETSWRLVKSHNQMQPQHHGLAENAKRQDPLRSRRETPPASPFASFSSRDTVMQDDGEPQPGNLGLYPSLSPSSLQSFSPKPHQSHMRKNPAAATDDDIRYVGETAESPVKQLGTKSNGVAVPGAYVFGSGAIKAPFTFVAPGTKSAADQVTEEMNARVDAARLVKSTSSMPASNHRVMPLSSVFHGKHKRVFERMDSITSHYAAKRKRPRQDTELTAKRSKVVSTTATDKKMVAGLVGSGWTAPMSGNPGPVATRLGANRKRQFELERARRKSLATQVGPRLRKNLAQSGTLKAARSEPDTKSKRALPHLVAVSTPPRQSYDSEDSRAGPSRLVVNSPMTSLKSNNTPSTTRTTTKPRPFAFASATRARTYKSALSQVAQEQRIPPRAVGRSKTTLGSGAPSTTKPDAKRALFGSFSSSVVNR
ncbi:tRNA methyltransferase, has a role in tRNA modification [Microbotryomycetes sp. JL201]|nr:tRNA methyltransferase, has a role in tRNA modification [Microbotryomycetes sp. JL201]